MVCRKILDERGIFTCDMDELGDQFDEIRQYVDDQSLRILIRLRIIRNAIFLLVRHRYAGQNLLRLDLNDIDEVLRQRGAVVDAHEYLRRQREQQQQQGWHLGQEVQ